MKMYIDWFRSQRILVIISCIFAILILFQSFSSNNRAKNNLKIGDLLTARTSEEILALEKDWAAALVANDLSKVEDLMHKDFRLIRVYGDTPPITREMYLGMKGMSATSAEVTSLRISEELGPIAVARVSWTLDWQQEGAGKLPPHFDMIDTWIKADNGKWQILSRISQVADKAHQPRQD
ncbi:nuclear transport factor 2 family protein [Gramella sp. GC03-9]|uniref:Nuclear transport factor 2 family protein n=1 Tax=Christiangramia oceanisediminis TaxID=2920386 RepID=A0A9X2R8Q8_9FLAO|nr:nuclear transport factor 2 family protein [Gramella oceanisediminis]MCP9200482.1 nuclear transport factor 2 family protein [Gramella oceanisediminis]